MANSTRRRFDPSSILNSHSHKLQECMEFNSNDEGADAGDIQTHAVNTIGECHALCKAHARCKAFVWSDKGAAWSPHTCWLKERVTSSHGAKGYHFADVEKCNEHVDGNVVIEGSRTAGTDAMVGEWGGSCKCPNGQVYYAGDQNDHCGSLACFGGVSGTCNRHKGAWSKNIVVCGSKNAAANVAEKLPEYTHEEPYGVGGYGGHCQCPNGQIYLAGDRFDNCDSLACFGGKTLNCYRSNTGPWSTRRVTCDAYARHDVVEYYPPVPSWFGEATKPGGPWPDPQIPGGVTIYAPAGGWGGTCTCPNGKVYQVGDNFDHCGSLACIGGVSGPCQKNHGEWSYRRVTCSQATGAFGPHYSGGDIQIVPNRGVDIEHEI